MNLKQRFEAIWAGMFGTDATPAWNALDAGYRDATRAYHDWRHIEAMLTGLDAVRGEAEFVDAHFDLIELVIFFHDAVYDPLAKDNEARSAHLLRQMGADKDMRDGVAMIEATATHAPSHDMSTRVLLDLDLAVLGRKSEHYEAYVQAVRREYAAVPDDAWRAGRAAVLRRFLDKDAIFQTAHFNRKLERQARSNIAAEIASLEAPTH